MAMNDKDYASARASGILPPGTRRSPARAKSLRHLREACTEARVP
jgi:hypothetical protein